MRCPKCLFEGNLVNGRCARCGYTMMQGSSGPSHLAAARSAPLPELSNQHILMRGDTLSQGRYRILNRITLPKPQQGQGTAWSAIDLQASNRAVVIREVAVPQEMARASSADRVATAAAQTLQRLGQYAGFPQV